MFSYFIDKYIGMEWGDILTALISVIAMYLVCLDIRDKSRRVWIEILRFLMYYVIWFILSSAFYWAFPSSDIGFALVPLLFVAIYIAIDRRLVLWNRLVRMSIFVTIYVYGMAISLPINIYIDIKLGIPLFNLLFKSALYALVIFVLWRFALTKRTSVWPIALIEAVCVIGYALNLVSIVIGIGGEFQSPFSSNFFNSISLTVIELLAYFMFYKLGKESEKKEQLLAEEQRMKNELKMMSMYEIGYNQVRSVRHEIYNQYSYVNIMLKNKQYKEAEEYFDQLRVFVGSMGKTVYTENRIINIALNLAVEQAEDRGIKIDVNAAVPKYLDLQDSDLAGVLNNLANNGIEACERLPEVEKKLKITVSYDNGFLLVRSVNPVGADVREGKNMPIATTKTDDAAHGYGLKIINKIAEKNDGCFDYEVSNGKFVAKVLMRCNATDSKEEK